MYGEACLEIYRDNLDVIDLAKGSKEIMEHGVGDSGNMKAALEVEEQPNIDRTFDQGCRHKWWRKAVQCRWTLCVVFKERAKPTLSLRLVVMM